MCICFKSSTFARALLFSEKTVDFVTHDTTSLTLAITALKLTQPENIIDMKDMVLATARDNSQAGRMLMHLVEGTRDSKQFSGIHHLPYPLPHYIKNFKIIEPPDRFGVYTASFDVLDDNGKVLQKENNSTLFPKDWSRQLYDECLYALNHKIKIEQTSSSYLSKTMSGIPVEIHFDREEKKIRTLYPVQTCD